ncbi:Palmitoyltransferase zdhhc17, partial [Quaeritorhiza haematococci]
MVTYLYKKGGDPTRKDNQGYNALHLAAHAGHSMMITYLIHAVNMDVDTTDSMDRTPLMWTAYQGNSPDSMDVLIRAGADLDKVDKTAFTALHWAI